MKDIRKTIGNLIKQRRKLKKLTQIELANLVDVDSKYISRIETGISYPSLSVVEKIFNVLNISFKENVSELDEPKESDKLLLTDLINHNLKQLSLKELNTINDILNLLIENK